MTRFLPGAALAVAISACTGEVVEPVDVVRSISVGPSGSSVTVGATLQMSAAVDADPGVATSVVWSSSAPLATVGASTGLVTGVAVGTAMIQACSTVPGFTSVCGSTPVLVVAAVSASVQITGATWVPPAGPTGCAPGNGAAVPITATTMVSCQISVSVNAESATLPLERVDLLIGSQVVSSMNVTPVRGAPTAKGIFAAPTVIVLSTNTAQLRKNGNIFVPVVFNGNASITARLYLVGSSTPVNSQAFPAIMNNSDAIVALGTAGAIPAMTLTANTPLPRVTDGGGNEWFKGPATLTGMQYIAYSTRVPIAVPWSGSICENSTSVVSGTPTAGIALSGVFACSNTEGANTVTGFLPPTYAPPLGGPDGTPLTVPTVVSNVGAGFTVAGDQRWNLITPAVPGQTFPTLYTDNKGPTVIINPVAFNPAALQSWINPAFDLVAQVTASDAGPVVGGTPIKTKNVRLFAATCGTTPLPSPHGLAGTQVSDAYRVCGGATDFLDNLGLSAASNGFGVDNVEYTATVTGGYTHATGIPGVSFECKLITTNPARPGGTYTMTVTGPGVVPGQGPFTGTLDNEGKARVTVQINAFGTYRNVVTVASPGGILRQVTLDVVVGAGASSCP